MAYTLKTFHPISDSCAGYKSRQDFIYEGLKAGEKVVGWRDKLKKGVNASSDYYRDAMKMVLSEPMSGSITEYFAHITLGAIGITELKFNGFYQSIAQHSFGHAASTSSADEAQALSRLYSRIREYASSVNGLQFLGELREAIHMIRNPANAFLSNTERYLKALEATRKEVKRRVKPRKSDYPGLLALRRRNAVKNAMSGSWLELQFGLLPLVSDVRNIAAATLELLEPRFVKTRFVGTSDLKYGYQPLINAYGTITGNGAARYSSHYSCKTEASVRYIAVFKREVTSDGLAPMKSLAQTYGFTLENFVPTAWELTPWSFLIDYFVNIGDILEAVSTDVSGLVSAVKVVRQKTLFDAEAFLTGYNYGENDWNILATSGKTTERRQFERITLSRTKLDSIPYPPLVFSLPGESSKKWLNMAALLMQARDFRF